MIIPLVLCACLGALAVTYVLSETYKSSALLLVRPADVGKVTKPPGGFGAKEALGYPLVGVDSKVFSRSYAAIIQSREIAKEIVDELQLDKLAKPVVKNPLKRAYKYLKKKIKVLIYYTWTIMKHGGIKDVDPYDNLVSAIHGSISASEIRETNLIQITVRSQDPEFGAIIANTAAKVFVKHWRKTYYEEAKQNLALVKDQFETNNAELNNLVDSLYRYKKKEGIVDLEAQIPSKISSLSYFERRLRQMEPDIQELLNERKEIQRQLASRRQVSTSATITSENPVVTELKQILSGLEIDMAGLKKRFTSSHHDVVSLQAKIDETRKRLAEEAAQKVAEETSSTDPVYLGLEERLSEINARLPALEAKRDSYLKNVEQYRVEVDQLRDKAEKHDALERGVEQLKEVNLAFFEELKDFDFLASKRPEETLLVSPATPPVYPSGPIKILYVGIAFGVSLVLGITLAFFLEYINNRIRTVEEAESSLDIPVLATIPRTEKLAGVAFPGILLPEVKPSP